jgi:hypothetical protein
MAEKFFSTFDGIKWITNMFFRNFSPFLLLEKKIYSKKTLLFKKKSNLSFGPFFKSWSYIKLYVFGQKLIYLSNFLKL